MTTEHRRPILFCIVITIAAVLGITFGIKFNKPLITALVILLPVIYELRQAKGLFGKIISLLSLIILFAEIYALTSTINVDLSRMTAGMLKHTINAAMLGPVILIIFSIYLLRYAAGVYSKWLSIIILICSIVLCFIIPDSNQVPEVQEKIQHIIQF